MRVTILGWMVLFISCNDLVFNNNKGEIFAPSILSVEDTIYFNIPDSIPSPFSRSNLYWNSNENFVGFLGDLDGNKIQIQVLNIQTGKWQTINLLTEGENQVFGMGSFSFNNDNTITYFPIIISRILNVNFQGEVISNVEFSEQYLHAINNSVWSPNVMKANSKLGFLSMEYLDMDKPENYDIARLYTIYDFETDSVQHIIKYPEEFRDNAWSTNDQSITTIYNENKIVFNFSKSQFLYVYDIYGKLDRKINVRVKGVGDAQPLQEGSDDPMKNMLRTEATGKYASLIYDKWRKVYYRVGTFYDISNFNPKTFKELSEMRPKLTYVIVTLNEELEVMGADYFNHTETNINNGSYFVNRDGLYMNLKNKDENTLCYVKLMLK